MTNPSTYDPENLTPSGELIHTEFVDAGPSIGSTETDEEYERECELLDDCYTRVCDGKPYTILARPAREGEVAGTYAETNRGLQILGCSTPVPTDVAELMRAAWELYCALPRDEEATG